MKTLKSLQSNLGSLFVVAAFLDDFNIGVGTNIAMTLGAFKTTNRSRFCKSSAHAAFPLASVLDAAQDICFLARVVDEESMEEMFAIVQKQFDIVAECCQADKELAREVLERCFDTACQNAREALNEVQGGFPVSGGDFAVWKENAYSRGPR